MTCQHSGFHSTSSSYDRARKRLVYFARCDRCGARLKDLYTVEYRPNFDPRGNDRYLGPLAPAV